MALRHPLIFALFLSASFSFAQTPGTLRIGDPISRDLKKGERHQYTMSLTGNQFVRLDLEQKGIDIQITAWNPNGDPIGRFDSPNGMNGPEVITFSSELKGMYTFSVEPLSENPLPGSYDFEVTLIEPIGQTKEKRIDQIMSLWDTKDSPGASIAVVQNGQTVFSKGYGMANLEYDVPIETNSIFHIASISKQVTAFAILLLEEDGKLSMDDDIRDYLPEVPDFGTPITLRHLANHTSGLRDQWNLIVMAGWRMDDVITTEQVMRLVAKQKELNFQPGEEFLYCNTGFTLLAEIVNRVTGMSFADFTQQRIFTPLQMENTLFYDDHEKLVKNRVYSYYKDGNNYQKSKLSYAIPGATSLFTTPEDLAKWAMNFENPKVGTEESLRKMEVKGVLNNGDSTNYGLGQSIDTYNGLYKVGHGGSDAGFRSQISRFPNEKFAVIVFGNESSFSSSRIANQITDLYLSESYLAEKKVQLPKQIAKIKVTQDLLASYTGEYDLQPGVVMSITTANGKLFGELSGQEKFKLIPESNSMFQIEGSKAKLSFHSENSKGSGEINLIKFYQNGSINRMNKHINFEPEFIDLDQFIGSFYSEELSTEYILSNESNVLFMMHPRLSKIALIPQRPDVFGSTSWSFSSIDFTRDNEGNITGFYASNGRVRNLWFEKKVK
jgi:CubicO group peptidase (beta-lactamase class C family)